MKTDPNQHIKEYLDHYIGLSHPPKFAVLLRGKWGIGKTWFINQYRESKKVEEKDINFLFVSLYGISTFQEIEDSFFQQVHPILSSKGMKLAGKILKGLVKTTIKVDWDQDGNPDGSITSSVPNVDLPDYLKNLGDRVIVFDDLERCSMPLANMLGYINQLVENLGSKVIVLGNEEEILKDEESSKTAVHSKEYLRIKEKLIGWSFTIQPSYDKAFRAFQLELEKPIVSNFLDENKTTVSQVYNTAGYNNLRHLRLAFLDLSRFYEAIPKIAFKKKKLLDHLIKIFFTIALELRGGSITEKDISTILTLHLHFGETGDKEDKIQQFKEKHAVFSQYFKPCDNSIWVSFFRTGQVDKNLFEKSVLESIYFEEENTPGWMKLHNYLDLEDADFKNLTESVYSKLANQQFEDKYEVVQVTGMLTFFSHLGLLEHEKEKIITSGNNNLERIRVSRGLLLDHGEDYFPGQESHGLKYHGLQVPEFQKFLIQVEAIAEKTRLEFAPKLADEVLNALKNSIHDFEMHLSMVNSRNGLYHDTAILVLIPVGDFTQAFLRLDNRGKRRFAKILSNRYRTEQYRKKLLQELDWLMEFQRLLTQEQKSLKGKVSGRIIEQEVLKVLDEVISQLKILKAPTA